MVTAQLIQLFVTSLPADPDGIGAILATSTISQRQLDFQSKTLKMFTRNLSIQAFFSFWISVSCQP